MKSAPYELQLESYRGPLEKLLELIEERKMEITEVSLSQVTDDFLKYLAELRTKSEGKETEEMMIDLRLLADFILIASRLLFIKSKALLPDAVLSEEEESDIHDLETRLQVLRELKPAFTLLDLAWRDGKHAWSRPYLLNSVAPQSRDHIQVFYPSPGLTAEALEGSLKNIFAVFEKFAMENETIRDKVVSLESKIKEIISRVREFAETSFARLSGKSASRSEVVIAFLAILHLAREQMVMLEQENHLSDIIIKPRRESGAVSHDRPTS